jgi:hypothetical protein
MEVATQMTSQLQLSLFDTASVIQPAYKIGDLVEIRKKPIAASYVKKGDVVEIAAVHPLNGSIKFWNERSERWEFLHPDEIGSIVPPADSYDSVSSKAEIADTEYTVPPADNYDSVSSKAEIADTEYTVPPADNYDSVSSKAEIADTEYTVPPADNYDSVSSKAISTYRPRGTARSGEYFRFSYRDGSRMRHIHIRGGDTDSPIAQAKVQELRSLLAAGISRAEIATMIRNSGGKAPTLSSD